MYSILITTTTALLASIPWAVAQEVTTDSVRNAFTQARVVPDVLRSFEPQGILEVIFTDPSSSQQIRVTPGMNLTRAQAASSPTFGISGLPPSFAPQTFVLALIDPDAPTPGNPSSAQFRHFLGGDFAMEGQLDETTPMLVNRSQAVSEYTGPNPPAGSAPHRYVFLLFNQNTASDEPFSATSASFTNSSSPRNNFNITRFAQDTQLTGPVAGTFFYVAPSSSAPTSGSSSSSGSISNTAVPPQSSSSSLFTPTGAPGSNNAIASRFSAGSLLVSLAGLLVYLSEAW